jgi:antitoxin component YwqK of YwqJK toxin-antitoxin module
MKRVPDESLTYSNGGMYLDGEPFTGIAYFLDDEGRLEAEVTYRAGSEVGLKRGWFENGQPSYEVFMFNGVFHGKKREWHRNGQLAEDSDYELGFELRHKRWDEEGELIEEFELDKDDPGYKRLEKFREAYKVDLAEDEERRAREEREQ